MIETGPLAFSQGIRGPPGVQGPIGLPGVGLQGEKVKNRTTIL